MTAIVAAVIESVNIPIKDIHQVSSYSDMPKYYKSFLYTNVTRAAGDLIEISYDLTHKTGGIIEKSHAYFAKVMGCTVRHIRRLWKELEDAGCVIIEAMSDRAGRLCNRYILTYPAEVAEKILANPRKKSLAAKLKELQQRITFNHIDFSVTPLETAYDEPLRAPPHDIFVTPLISSDLKVSNNNKQSNVIACGTVIRNEANPIERGGKLILDREPTPLGEYWEANVKEFIHSLPNISNPQELYREMEFSISRRFFSGQTLMHAAHVAKKLVRDGRWRRPLGLIRLEPGYEVEIPHDDNPDDLTPINSDAKKVMADMFQIGSYNPRREANTPDEKPEYFVSTKRPVASVQTRDEQLMALSKLALSSDVEVQAKAQADLRDLMMRR